MYFVEYDIEKLNDEKGKRNSEKNHPLVQIIDEFRSSGFKCAKLCNTNYRNSKTAYESIKHHLDRHDMNYIKIHIRNGEVYLVNTLFIKG